MKKEIEEFDFESLRMLEEVLMMYEALYPEDLRTPYFMIDLNFVFKDHGLPTIGSNEGSIKYRWAKATPDVRYQMWTIISREYTLYRSN